MKKRKLDKNLALAKETLKSLDPREIEGAEGGAGGGTLQNTHTCWGCTGEFSICLC